ncbi:MULTISPECIES: PilT/PilU family type 4a pilus ATPase [Thiorhodovibrio]|uniref:PilT/PilU family type 4a pilus ATPase n=1 Tax=Thiorhodovibrio TaxID=61593 RepID=UPI001911EA2E|nr:MULTISPECIES: PilT/PilU family type 4a pilus ATPase [Thiorhodovibrio]MBK5967256.1 type IV pili twitching motility protein PilT [Thiorhodovibrio winogradskyi]WPL14490.1 Twitching mobility protein [Thiorhodovibrio litoralis]
MDITPYLKLMVQKHASDLFFTAGTQVKIKIDGVIQSIGDTVFDTNMCAAAIHSILTREQIEFFETHREIDFGIGLTGQGRFRVNAFHQRGTPAMVIRYLTSKIPTIEELGLPEILKRLILHRRGIILMVGATGSGKSTTLAAMIDHRNISRPGHILTIEDPIEYLHGHKKSIVNQRELGIDTMDYATALKSALREAPDVILIGEIRTRETMEAAIELSGTGHLAISTLHANNAYQTMERIINMFPKEMHRTLFMDLSLNLRAIISQRLVRTVEGKRVAAIEILMNTPHISDLIREGRVDEIRQAMAESKEEGMTTFDDALLKLYRDGLISLEECLANSDSAANLEARINFG